MDRKKLGNLRVIPKFIFSLKTKENCMLIHNIFTFTVLSALLRILLEDHLTPYTPKLKKK